MRDLIRSLDLTSQNTKGEIEQALLEVADFSSDYYAIKKMNCDSYCDAAKEIFEQLQNEKFQAISEKLRSEFTEKTGVAAVFANRSPYIQYIEWLEKKVAPTFGAIRSYEIDFGSHCRAGVDITNNEPKVVGAMNGRGFTISPKDIKIRKL